jgi:hypothetical protein
MAGTTCEPSPHKPIDTGDSSLPHTLSSCSPSPSETQPWGHSLSLLPFSCWLRAQSGHLPKHTEEAPDQEKPREEDRMPPPTLQVLKALLSNTQVRDISPPDRGMGSREEGPAGGLWKQVRKSRHELPEYLDFFLGLKVLFYKLKNQSQTNLKDFLPLKTFNSIIKFLILLGLRFVQTYRLVLSWPKCIDLVIEKIFDSIRSDFRKWRQTGIRVYSNMYGRPGVHRSEDMKKRFQILRFETTLDTRPILLRRQIHSLATMCQTKLHGEGQSKEIYYKAQTRCGKRQNKNFSPSSTIFRV